MDIVIFIYQRIIIKSSQSQEMNSYVGLV